MLESSDSITWGEDSELEASRISQWKCPACGEDVKDKGSYIRCTSCEWGITNGSYYPSTGIAVQYKERT